LTTGTVPIPVANGLPATFPQMLSTIANLFHSAHLNIGHLAGWWGGQLVSLHAQCVHWLAGREPVKLCLHQLRLKARQVQSYGEKETALDIGLKQDLARYSAIFHTKKKNVSPLKT
jgi:hypothetical protein